MAWLYSLPREWLHHTACRLKTQAQLVGAQVCHRESNLVTVLFCALTCSLFFYCTEIECSRRQKVKPAAMIARMRLLLITARG